MAHHRTAFCTRGLVLAVGFFAVVGCGQGRDAQQDRAQAETEKPRPDFTLTARELADEFARDREGYARKYTPPKLVQLTGTIGDVAWASSNERDLDVLYLDGRRAGNGVSCAMKDMGPWKKALPGQKVTLLGTPASHSPALGDCVITEVSGNGPPNISADDLAAEWKANAEAATKKYRDRNVIVKGRIAKIESDGNTLPLVILKTQAAEPIVFCAFNNQYHKRKIGLAPGQEITVVGSFIIDHPSLVAKGTKSAGTSESVLLEKAP
jgi:hypothetical protein